VKEMRTRVLIERGQEAEFQRYQRAECLTVVNWLDGEQDPEMAENRP
jgi:hypothetical protein